MSASRSRATTRRPAPRRSHFLRVEGLEDRTVPSTSLVAIGADAGGGPRVTLLDRDTGAVVQNFMAYDPSFTGGVRVAVADFNGDGTPDVVTAPGKGISPTVKVFDGKTGALLQTFNAFEPGFTGGINLAVGDLTGSGTPDIIVAADAGGGPRVQVLDGKSGAVLRDFFAFEPGFAGGVRVAAADVNGDGKDDIVTAAGPGGGPAVRVFDGVTGNVLSTYYAYEPGFAGGVYVAAADLTGDGKAEVVTGPGSGGGPAVRVLDGMTGAVLNSFFAYNPAFTGGVRVGAFAPDAFVRPVILTAPGPGGGTDVHIYEAPNGTPTALYSAFDPGFTGGSFVAASSFAATVAAQLTGPTPTATTAGTTGGTTTTTTPGQTLVTLQLNPLNINLLGLQVQTSPITVTVSVDTGGGKLLGNLLTVVSNLVNLQGVNTALNNVLGSVVSLVNSAALTINSTVGNGPLTNAQTSTTPVLNLYVAPVHLGLLGAKVDTSPITVTLTANAGNGQILANVVSDLAHLFDPPLPNKLDLGFINNKLQQLLDQLNSQLAGIPSAPVDPVTITDNSQVLRLIVPPINLNLLGLNLQTDQIRVNADAQVGSGDLLGNVVTALLNTLDATPAQRQQLSNNLNALLAKVIGVLNATNLVLPSGAVQGLTQVLQTLALPNLVTAQSGATTPVLNLTIASPDSTTPPVDVNLLGLSVTTSNVHAQLNATTGSGQVLGNLVYNVAHLLDPGGSLNLLTILGQLGL